MARRQHRHRRVVSMQLGGLECLSRQRRDQRLQQGARAAYPVRQRRALQRHALPGVDLALPIQRQMIGILGHQHVGEQAGARQAAGDRPRRGFALHDTIAARAHQLRPNVPDYSEARWHVLQHLRGVFTQPPHRAAAVRARADCLVNDLLARQMIGQRPPPRSGAAALRFACCAAC